MSEEVTQTVETEQRPEVPETDDPVSSSPPWGRSTKLVVIVAMLVLFAFAVMRFQGLIGMVTVAAVIAYILNPLVEFVNERTQISRGWVILGIYVLLAAALVGLFISLGVAAYDQATDFIELVPRLINETVSTLQSLSERTEPVVILDTFTFEPLLLPWDSITDQLLGLIQPTLSTSGGVISQLATRTVRTVGNFVFVFVISIYLIFEFPNFRRYFSSIASQPGYQSDAEHIATEVGRIWNAYLRGQVILGGIIFVVVWLGLSLLGVRNALALGLIAGLLEFVPTIGPVISTVVAMFVAFFQPENPWGLESWQFALIVLALMVIIQQVENNVLVPRIVGGALDLHPLIVIIGVFMGASVAGILGAILAAPILATIKLLINYTWRKLFDLPPFPEPESIPDPPLEETSAEAAAESESSPQAPVGTPKFE